MAGIPPPGGVGPGAGPGAVPPPILVALFPGETVATPLNLIDDANDIKMYHKAIVGITELYDLKPRGLKNFLLAVKQRARLYNWDAILNVPDAFGHMRPFIQQYDNVTMEECQDHAINYMGQRLRNAQNSMMLYQFLSNSISDKVKSDLTVQSELYDIDGLCDGLCFLKLIVSTAQVDTIARVSVLRNSLKRLERKVTEYSGNLIDLHAYVRETMSNLAAYGEIMQDTDLVNSLFEEYEVVEDDKFQNYITNKQVSYEEGTRITPQQLMTTIENYYKLRVEAGKLKSPTKANNEIMALKVQIEKLQTTNAKVNNSVQGDGKHAWKKVPPKSGETTKEVDGRVWNWCKNHKAWCQHTYEKCRGVTVRPPRTDKVAMNVAETTANNKGKGVPPDTNNPTVQVNDALTTIIEDGALKFR
jgi:hypothetical protein